MNPKKRIIVSGGFDDIRSRDLRFLEEASKLGELSVLLWPDAVVEKAIGKAPRFTLAERLYLLNAVRYVSRVIEADGAAGFDTLPNNLCPNVRLLKGEGHPLLSQEERRYVVGSIRYVKQALITTGSGWVDADPEIRRLKPDVYVVNEDGDKGGKRGYCAEMGMEYLVLKRTPAPGLPKRSSTDLRGF